jgi:hypothetical protein
MFTIAMQAAGFGFREPSQSGACAAKATKAKA